MYLKYDTAVNWSNAEFGYDFDAFTPRTPDPNGIRNTLSNSAALVHKAKYFHYCPWQQQRLTHYYGKLCL